MNYYNPKALPTMAADLDFQDSLDIQIMEDPAKTSCIDITEMEMQKQIDAYTAMMREKSGVSSTNKAKDVCGS